MNLKEKFIVNNWCYKYNQNGRYAKTGCKGIVVHSTGCNQTSADIWQSIWNRGSTSTAVHAVIGLSGGAVVTYQMMPWNYQSWGCGGRFNHSHIQFEIAEDGLTDEEYFGKVFNEAADLCSYLCREYGISVKDIVSHAEAYRLGGASNHADCDHWLKKHGKSMDWFRAEVEARMNAEETYITQEGDTVESVSARFGGDIQKLTWLLLVPGQEIAGEKSTEKPTEKREPQVGDVVRFIGTQQYRTANSDSPWPAKPCEARVERIYDGKHPYSLRHTGEGGVYGWVNREDIEA